MIELIRRPGDCLPGRATDAEIDAALETVVDPCSMAQATPLSLPAMGLVRGRLFGADGELVVDVAVTAPGCAYVGLFADAAARALSGLAGVREVVVRLDPDVAWSEKLLRPDAAGVLSAAREDARARLARRLRPVAAGSGARR